MENPQNLICKGRDWSRLPPDLVNLIAKKLPRLLDYIHVHLTCTNWHSSTPLSDFQVRFPWVLEFHQKPGDFISVPSTKLQTYSISSGETLTVPVKESSWYTGFSNNYLPFIDNDTGTISLLNPFTNDEFATPLIHDPRKPFSSYMVGTELGPIRGRKILLIKYEQYLSHVDRWAIYDPHNGRWSQQGGLHICYSYCQGMFFHSTRGNRKTEVFDLSKKLLYTIPPHEDDIMDAKAAIKKFYCFVYKCYVVISTGEIWRIHWYHEINILTNSFKIYRLHFEGEARQPRWVKITDNIGDEIIFLEMSNYIATGSSVTAASTNGLLRGGQIYFIDPFNMKLYVYDFASGTVAAVPCPFEKCTFFVPGLG